MSDPMNPKNPEIFLEHHVTRWLVSQKGTRSPQRRASCQGSHKAGGLRRRKSAALSLKAQNNPGSVSHDDAADSDNIGAKAKSF